MKLLDLTSTGEQQLSIAAFGATRGGPKVCPIVSATVSMKG